MVNLYANRIIADAGKDECFTIDNVPSLWNTKALVELNRRCYDGYGQPLKETL